MAHLNKHRGQNTVACTKGILDDLGPRGGGGCHNLSLPHQPVIKDLVPDITNFYAQLTIIERGLQTTTPTP